MSNIQQRQAALEVEFPGMVGVMHGRSADKESLLQEFRSGAKPILLSTTVIEVGIDVPEAKGIVIEQAEQYGLAQLHQLRGRVGRGKIPGDCILIYKDGVAWYAKRRLKVMKDHQDGFVIAEEDKMIRGHGDVLGNMQSGMVATFRFFEPETMDDPSQYSFPSETERVLWGKSGDLMYSA
jgi:ATP-dependent DNA helicase RecG